MDSVTANRIKTMLPMLDEKQRRIYLAAEAESIGFGGVKAVHDLTGVSKTTIIRGKKELKRDGKADCSRVRVCGGGRKSTSLKYLNIKDEIERIVGDETYGTPENILAWTTKSLRNIEKALYERGFEVSHDTVGNLLRELGYSLQQNQKMLQLGTPHPDRDAQFKYINKKGSEFIKQGQPVISVDTKKKELIGNFKNIGLEYKIKKNPTKVLDHDFPINELGKVVPYGIYDINKNIGLEYKIKKNPTKVLDHDFPINELGKVVPYGIYDINENVGFVNLGISRDTAEFAVESILRWWLALGKRTYPNATKLYINSDSGGSNGYRIRLWKKQLQEFVNITGLEVHVSHFPPGTSKWNKIEHKLFCFISKNWRGTPLISVETVINLISSTTTSKGLKVICVKDDNKYELGTKVTDDEIVALNMKKDIFHGDWNYTIRPQK